MTGRPQRASARAETDPLTTLRNILLLEQRRGYDNRAVVGGLAALVDRAATSRALTDELLHPIRGYAEQTTGEREASVAAVLQALTHPGPTPQPDVAGASIGDDGWATARDAPAETHHGSAQGPSAQHDRTTADSPTRREPAKRPVADVDPATPVSSLPGIGPARAKRLAALEIRTVGDLRFHLPHRHIDYPAPAPASDLGFQHLASFEGTVTRVDVSPMPGRRVRITAVLADETGSVAAVWIRAGRTAPPVRVGARLALSGPLVRYGRQVYFENPDFEPAAALPLNTRRTIPVYALTAGISQPLMRAMVRQALDRLPPLEECLPPGLLADEGLVGRNEAVRAMHWPTSSAEIEAARRRLGFDEMLPIQLLVLQGRRARRANGGPAIPVAWPLLAEFRRGLPFSLTAAQQRVLSAILDDISRGEPMARLLQGEVGSGKTVVAAMAILSAVAAGGQAAMIAPTEILAEQHFRTLSALYSGTQSAIEGSIGRPLRITRLSGTLSRSQREHARREIAAGEIDLVVGTHAVLQGGVEFPSLTLAIVDEQHRFGVGQRVALRQKGANPHLLVMTATPIPRTLALTLYGDLDVSVIDELPPGRQPVTTTLLRTSNRSEAYERVRTEVAAGHQAFVICPLVEGSPATEARAATTEYERLHNSELTGIRLALLHGRLAGAEKDRVMTAFAAGERDVLISTSVVEVGIDVPNATVMVVEGAERFGLAQLHQFRGRVGRGGSPASCFLIAATESPESLERLSILARSANGLELAEEDLRIRGPGDYFGLRQSGFPTLRVSRLADLEFIQHVRDVGTHLLESDPYLERPEHRCLALAVRHFAQDAGEAN